MTETKKPIVPNVPVAKKAAPPKPRPAAPVQKFNAVRRSGRGR